MITSFQGAPPPPNNGAATPGLRYQFDASLHITLYKPLHRDTNFTLMFCICRLLHVSSCFFRGRPLSVEFRALDLGL